MSTPALRSKYRVIRRLGVGAMGEIHEAEHLALGKRVAIKWLQPHLARQPAFVARFIREARAAAQIRHPNVVKVFDVEQTAEGEVFMVMELVAGEPLDHHLDTLRQQARRLPTREGIRLMQQLLDGVTAAHDAGVIHRDLKPSNIMLSRDADGEIVAKILDFGIAKLKTDSTLHPLTEPGTILGTPEYMPPEVALAQGEADARGDVFSLAVVLYEMFAGTHPAPGIEPIRVPIVFHRRTYPRLAEAAPWLPAPLAAAIDQALSPDPARRFDGMRAFREAVAQALEASANRPRPVPPFPPSPSFASAAVPGNDDEDDDGDDDGHRHDSTAPTAHAVDVDRRTSRRLGWSFAVAAAASLIAGAGALFIREIREPALRLSARPVTAVVPEVTVAPPPAPEPAPPELWRRPSSQITGQRGDERLRLRHTLLRDEASQVRVALRVERPTVDSSPVKIVDGALSFLHYLGYQGPRRRVDPGRYPTVEVPLARSGKYHVRGWLTLEDGERMDFDCDICVDDQPRHCRNLRPSCSVQ